MSLFDSVFGGILGGSNSQQRDANVFRDNASLGFLNQANTGAIGAFGSMPDYNRRYLDQTGAPMLAESGQGGEQGGTYGSLRQSLENDPFLTLLTKGETASPLVRNYLTTAGVDLTGASNQNPYGLTDAQAVQANAQGDAINKRRDSAVSQLRAQMASRGITDPRALAAAEAHINEQFGGQAEQSRANFAEQARANRQNALGGLMSAGEQAYNTRQNELGNLFNTFLSLMTAGNAGTSNLGGAAQQQANLQQQRQDSSLSGLLNLIGFATGGGFNARPNIQGTPPFVGNNGYGTYGPEAPGAAYGDYNLLPYSYG